MAVIERTYNVPLRREFLRAPRYKRAKTAVNALRKFLQRHMKSEEVFIGRRLNEKLWERGIKNPPHHVQVGVVKEEDGKVFAELLGFKYEKPVVEEEGKKKKKEAKEELAEGKKKIEEEFKKLEEKTERIKEEKEKKGEDKEKKLDNLSKHEGKKPSPRGNVPTDQHEKKRKEKPANA
jgi:large subunit ribosomal protein L31e